MAPLITGGARAGSLRVFGHGTANVPSPLLEICSAGPNGIPEGCAPGSDDELLGTGGTDALGNFVQGGSPGIGLNRPLVAGEFIFAIDLQNNITGPQVAVQQSAPIPDVNPWGAAALTIGLIVALALRLRAARPL